MSKLDRRDFLKRGAVGGVTAVGGLGRFSARAAEAQQNGKGDLVAPNNGGHGPLVPDPAGVLALPAGFS